MRIPIETRLRRALDRRDIPEHVRRAVYNDVFTKSKANAVLIDENSWDSLIAGLQHSIFNLTSNRSRWPADMSALYEQYLRIMRDVRADIDVHRAKMLDDPDGPAGTKVPATLALVTAAATKENAALLKQGKPIGPRRGTHWPTWVDPAEARELVSKFEQAYAVRGLSRGKRLVPFATTSIAKETNRTILRHRKFIEDQRDAVLNADPHADRVNGRVSTHYGALHLCALRMAEMWLDNYERDVKKRLRNAALDPVPINWGHMLTKEMRQRIKAADENPGMVTPEGLTSFLKRGE